MYPLCRFRPWSTTGYPFCGQSYPYDGVPRPFFGTEWPCRHSGLPSRMCARTFPCSGRGSCSLRTHGLGNLPGASFFLELQDAIEHVWEEWTPTADVRGMMHFGDRSQPSLPSPRAGKLRPSGPTAGVPSGTAAWAYTRRPSVPTGRGSLKKPEQGTGPPPSPAGGGPIQALLRRYTRNPMPTPHGLKGGPLSGLSRPPRTRQLALYRITFCRRSEIRHTDRIWPAISYLLSKNSKYHIIWIVYFSFHTILGHKKQPIHKIEC